VSRIANPRRAPRLILLLLATAVATTGVLVWMGPAHGAAPGTILPNLVADPVDGFHVEQFTFEEPPGSHHFVTRQLLRFNGYIHNKGPGAVDFRGSREPPTFKKSTLEAIERHEPFSVEQEEELANPPMKTTQRLFTTNKEETNFNRAHVEEESTGRLIYSSADGHNHWHLQEIARYTLMSAAKTEVVAPAQKVGFCLDDSEGQHPETGIGPSSPVYSDKSGRKFCREWEPQTSELWEGISPGWRDKYESGLALQWVDISNVQPGEYQLRDEVNPLGFVIEEPGANPPSFTPVTISGYVALPQNPTTAFQTARPITLEADQFAPKSAPKYEIVGGPSHGTLSGSGSHRVYTPTAGFSGTDSFTFRAREESNLSFPEHPQVATVTVEVGEDPTSPGVQITSAPSSLVAGTSGTLAAASKNDTGAIEWSATGGATVKAEGLRGETASLAAPSLPGTITVTARLADDKAVSASRNVDVTAAPVPQPAPGLPPVGTPPEGGVRGQTVVKPVLLTRPEAMLVGPNIEMSTRVGIAGRARLSLYLGRQLLGSCVSPTPANRTYTCKLKLSRAHRRDRLRVIATLRTGPRLLATSLGPERIPKMVMVRAGSLHLGAHGASYASLFWCSPSAVVAALSGGE
jgi:hypothetical protein